MQDTFEYFERERARQYAKELEYLRWLYIVDEEAWLEGVRAFRKLRDSSKSPPEAPILLEGESEPEVDLDQHLVDVDPSPIDIDLSLVDTQVCPSTISIPTLLPILEKPFEGPPKEEELEKEKSDVVAHDVSKSLLPYKVKAIPDDFEQPMFVFKYGVLAKWHEAPQDEVEISLPTPPFCYGGDVQTNQPMKRKRYDDKVCIFSLYLPLCMPAGAQEDEWVKPWSIHSGRFKLLHMMPPDDIPRFPPPEEPPDPPIPPDKDEPG